MTEERSGRRRRTETGDRLERGSTILGEVNGYGHVQWTTTVLLKDFGSRVVGDEVRFWIGEPGRIFWEILDLNCLTRSD